MDFVQWQCHEQADRIIGMGVVLALFALAMGFSPLTAAAVFVASQVLQCVLVAALIALVKRLLPEGDR